MRKIFFSFLSVHDMFCQSNYLYHWSTRNYVLIYYCRHGRKARMPPVEERAELAGGWPSWSLGSATGYKPGHASRQLLVEEGMLLFSQGAEQEEGEPKPFKSLISNIDYFVGKLVKFFFYSRVSDLYSFDTDPDPIRIQGFDFFI
jgi:hypothetical protein